MSILAGVLLGMVAQTPEPEPAPAAPPDPCAAEQFFAFDFWIGEWDVYRTGTETQVATSHIEKVSNGCAVRETWMPLQGGGGTSITSLDPHSGTWRQMWVGAQPGQIEFEGGPVDGDMVLTGYWGRTPEGAPNLVRMTYSLEGDGSVRQYGQASTDHGRTWSDSFDLTYRPKAE